MGRDVRAMLGEVVGHLERTAAVLARAEHGPDRSTITRARQTLTEQASTLLVARAHLRPQERTEAASHVEP